MKLPLWIGSLCLLAAFAWGGVALGANVNRTQRGSIDWSGATLEGAGVYRKVVTLTYPVDASKAYVDAATRTSDETPFARVSWELTGTSIIFRSYQSLNVMTVDWEVVEFTDARVYRGSVNFPSSGGGATSQTAAIGGTVPLNKTISMISEHCNGTQGNKDEVWTVRARLSSTTQIELTRATGGALLTVNWQVIEFQDTTTTVYSGLATLNSTTLPYVDAPIGATVDLTRSFLLLTRSASSATGGKEAKYMLGGSFLNATTLRFRRTDIIKDEVLISWYVVQLGPDSMVETGTVYMPATGTAPSGATPTLANITIAAVDTDKTFAVVSVYGGGSDVHYLDEDSITAQLVNNTTLRFQRVIAGGGNNSEVNGVWFVIQYQVITATRETVDTDGDGYIDAIRFTAYEPVNDNFSGLAITVQGYTVTGYDTGTTANDNVFFARLQEGVVPDTGVTPPTQFIANSTLRGTISNYLLRVERAPLTPLDRAKPVLMTCDWTDGSVGGVSPGDMLVLTFSETVTTAGIQLTDFALPVINDTFDVSTIIDQGPSDQLLITLMGQPRLTPGGTYAVSAITPGAPSGIMVSDGSHIFDAANNTALNQTFATAVDIRPGTPVLAIAWRDLSISDKVWSVSAGLGTSYLASSAFTPGELTVRNVGNIRIKLTVSCTSTAVPAGWQLAAAAAVDRFEMKLIDGAAALDLVTPQVLVTQLYSGFEKPFDLRLTAPTDISNDNLFDTNQTIRVTITATQD